MSSRKDFLIDLSLFAVGNTAGFEGKLEAGAISLFHSPFQLTL
jgi:hypothetical protein